MKLSSRRLLSVTGVLMLLTALLHTVGNLLPSSDPAAIQFENTLRSFRFDAGLGMKPSSFDVHMVLVLTMTVTFAAFGILNLVLAAAPDVSERIVRRVVWINVIWVAAFTALSAFYRVPPPLISGVIIELPLLAALLRGTK
jgi:hypothetical protein